MDFVQSYASSENDFNMTSPQSDHEDIEMEVAIEEDKAEEKKAEEEIAEGDKAEEHKADFEEGSSKPRRELEFGEEEMSEGEIRRKKEIAKGKKVRGCFCY
jgi:peptidoglycan hydrolase CwlO-like protein